MSGVEPVTCSSGTRPCNCGIVLNVRRLTEVNQMAQHDHNREGVPVRVMVRPTDFSISLMLAAAKFCHGYTGGSSFELCGIVGRLLVLSPLSSLGLCQ
jgi:hypothetical protein